MNVTTSDIVAIWQAHADGAPLEDTRAALARLRSAVQGRSVSSVAHLDVLSDRLGEMSAGEWSAWWQVVGGWAHGFPPAIVPARPGANTSPNVACPGCGGVTHDIPGLSPAAIPRQADGSHVPGPYLICVRCGVISIDGGVPTLP